MGTLNIAIDARLDPGMAGGVESVILGLAHGLSRLEPGEESRAFVDAAHLHDSPSGRCAPGRRVLVPVVDGETTTLVEIEPASLTGGGVGLDPGQPYRHVTALVDDGEVVDAGIDWDAAVVAARGALAHELIAAARVMLEQARVHALQRVQFGRAIAGFQAVRHRLADALVSIEAATSVAADYVAEGDPLLAAVAKSLAGRAARTTAVHAQQVLAGIGFTTDHPFHLTMKRSLVLDTLFGSSRTLPAEIGAALLAAGHAPRLVEL